MNPFRKPMEALQERINDQKLYKEFQKIDQCNPIIAIKGDRHVDCAIRDDKAKTLRYFKEVTHINKTDWLVDERENKYYVRDVLTDQPFSFDMGNGIQNIKTTVVEYEQEPDPESLVDEFNLQMSATNKQDIKITLDHVSNSTITDIGKAISNISQSQDAKAMWRKLRHDLDYRFDFRENQKLIKNVDKTFEGGEGQEFDEDLFRKRADAIGGAIGTAMGRMLVILLEYFRQSSN
jgi:hypothetical protein